MGSSIASLSTCFATLSKSVSPSVVACDVRRLGTLKFDEECVSMRVVVEPTLDIEPLLELVASLRVVDVSDEVVDPLFDRTVHLVGIGMKIELAKKTPVQPRGAICCNQGGNRKSLVCHGRLRQRAVQYH